MTDKQLIAHLEQNVALAEKQGDDMDAVSWGMQEGILISCNSAKAVIEALKAFKISSNSVLVDSRCDHDYHTYFNKGYRKCNKCGFEKLM